MDVPVGSSFTSNVAARLDRLPWSAWHWRVVVALGITWALDGLEVTLVGAVAPSLASAQGLRLSESEIGGTATAYLGGAIAGALIFGRLTDLFGRKRLFFATLATYLVATFASGLAWSFWSFAILRAITGAGIGGEYAAVNSAIDELLPARVRGRADLAINGTYWLGTALGAALSLVLLNPRIVPEWLGWRLVFVTGATIGLVVIFMRRHLPESPRWYLLHGRVGAAERVMCGIEDDVRQSTGRPLPEPGPPQPFVAKGSVTFASIARVLLERHRKRTILGLSLMIAQAFAYNGVFFTYALVLVKFYRVAPHDVGFYLLPFAAGNFLGPVLLGPLFDTVGRRTMIGVTYGASGVLVALAGLGLAGGWLTAATQTMLWCGVFFVASAAASSSYLTVSELFPVELRGMAIALFYAVGTAVGGLAAPAIFGALLETQSRDNVLFGYLIGAALMIAAAVVAALLGVDAERRSLEALTHAE